jgi:hypothetical protein
MYTQSNVKKWKVPEILAIAATVLLLTYIADAAVGQGAQGFLPIDEAQRGMIFGTSSIVLFFAAFGTAFREIKPKLTSILLIAGGALMGTSVLGSILAAGGFAAVSTTFLVVMVLGYVIMGLGIVLGVRMRRRRV